MTQPDYSLPPAYFDRKYAETIDPWDFETSPYEAAKYSATLAALPREHYRSALEVGCSIGVLTAQLAQRCDSLLAIDVADQALARARSRCADLPQVRFERRQVPAEFPHGAYDLVVLSEVGYYLALPDLHRLQAQIGRSLQPGGDLVLVHWTPFVDEYPLTGDQVHESFAQCVPDMLKHIGGTRADTYRLDVFQRV